MNKIIERYEMLLAAWDTPHERHVVPTRSGDTFVLACGPADAPPVLAMQGSGGNSAMWLPQLAAWARHHRVYAVDVIGEPGLSAFARPPLDSDAYALWLDDVLAGLGVPAATFVGVSLGGWLALDYAVRRPSAVSRLVLLAPSGIGRRKVRMLFAALFLRPFGTRRVLSHAIGVRVRPGDALGDFAVLIFEHFKPRLGPIPVFTDAQLAALPMPVTAVVGARDAMLDSRGTAARLRAALPSASVTVLPGVGHLLPADAVDAALSAGLSAGPGHDHGASPGS